MKKIFLSLIAVAALASVLVFASLDTVSANEKRGSSYNFEHDPTKVYDLRKGDSLKIPISVTASDAADLKIFVSDAKGYPDEFTDWKANNGVFKNGISASLDNSEISLMSAESEVLNVTVEADENTEDEKRVLAVTLVDGKRFSQFYLTVNITE